MTRAAVARPAIWWLNMFDVRDFPDFHSLINFILNLRVAIPPILATLEVWNYQLNGSTDFVLVYLYRGALIGSYILALRLAYPSILCMLATAVAELVFIYGSVLVHPGNPAIYDACYPFFILLALCFLKQAGQRQADHVSHGWWCVGAGFS